MKTEVLGSALLIANEWFCFTDVINLSLYQKQNVTMVRFRNLTRAYGNNGCRPRQKFVFGIFECYYMKRVILYRIVYKHFKGVLCELIFKSYYAWNNLPS